MYEQNIDIINVLELESGIPSKITSFPIWEEQLSENIVEEAENFFKNLIWENSKHRITLEEFEQNIDFNLEEGQYDDYNGYEVHIIWSN